MRGKAVNFVPFHLCEGITPARAGKSQWLNGNATAGKDHPRACGEKCPISCKVLSEAGSPPRVRGKDDARLALASIVGITPARAGKSAIQCCILLVFQDHPRACGEKKKAMVDKVAFGGSPPRVRGKEMQKPAMRCICRITPARAGKSPTQQRKELLRWDHPRACGEK